MLTITILLRGRGAAQRSGEQSLKAGADKVLEKMYRDSMPD